MRTHTHTERRGLCVPRDEEGVSRAEEEKRHTLNDAASACAVFPRDSEVRLGKSRNEGVLQPNRNIHLYIETRHTVGCVILPGFVCDSLSLSLSLSRFSLAPGDRLVTDEEALHLANRDVARCVDVEPTGVFYSIV